MRHFNAIALACTWTIVLSGCSTLDSDYDKYADKHSAYQIIPRDDFEPIDLANLINGATPARLQPASNAQDQQVAHSANGAAIDSALRGFADKYRDSDALGRARRHAIQERLLAASDQRCNDFKNLLQKKFANVSFISGLTSTGASLAATIVENANTSKILAGVAGMASGYRAEYNQAFFANAAVQVIVAGIDSRRRTAYEQILRVRKEGLADYPLEAAVKDAIRYHGLCSTVSGLQEAAEAVRYYNEPGIAAATRTIARSKMLMDIQGASADQVIDKLNRWQQVVPAERYLAGNPLGANPASSTAEGQSLMDFYERNLAAMRKRSEVLKRTAKDESIPSTKYDAVVQLAEKTIATLDKSCKPILVAHATELTGLQASRAAAEGTQEDPLALKIQQAVQRAEIDKASVNFVVSGFLGRADNLEAALKEKRDNKDQLPAALEKAVQDALAKLTAFAPSIKGNCEVEKLE